MKKLCFFELQGYSKAPNLSIEVKQATYKISKVCFLDIFKLRSFQKLSLFSLSEEVLEYYFTKLELLELQGFQKVIFEEIERQKKMKMRSFSLFYAVKFFEKALKIITPD